MTSSIYPLPIVATGTPIGTDTDIIVGGIPIVRAQVSPGGGGILRLYFSFTMGGPSTVRVFNNSVLKGFLNADNSNVITDDGFYRFDIDVEEGDLVNIQSTVAISTVNLLRAHLVQFGA